MGYEVTSLSKKNCRPMKVTFAPRRAAVCDCGCTADGWRTDAGRTADGGQTDSGQRTDSGQSSDGGQDCARRLSFFCSTSVCEHRSYGQGLFN